MSVQLAGEENISFCEAHLINFSRGQNTYLCVMQQNNHTLGRVNNQINFIINMVVKNFNLKSLYFVKERKRKRERERKLLLVHNIIVITKVLSHHW